MVKDSSRGRIQAIGLVSVPEQAAFYVRDAARYLGISPNTLRKRSDLGLIMVRRDENGSRVFLLGDLDNYLDSLPPYTEGVNPIDSRPVETGQRKEVPYERPERDK